MIRTHPRLSLLIGTCCCLALAGAAAEGATCNVPSVYATIAAALADPTCDPIQVAAGTFTGNLSIARDVTLNGAGSASTTVAGWIAVSGAATDAVLNALRLDATTASASLCYAAGLDVSGGARASGLDLVVVGKPTPTAGCGFFADGFESGDTARWSSKRG